MPPLHFDSESPAGLPHLRSQRTVLERDLQEHPASVLVDAKVDATGRAAPIRLRIQKRVYEF